VPLTGEQNLFPFEGLSQAHGLVDRFDWDHPTRTVGQGGADRGRGSKGVDDKYRTTREIAGAQPSGGKGHVNPHTQV
jgi:hypothetical protein